jgi:hypothetical protein
LLFDALWKRQCVFHSRDEAYEWLCGQLGLTREQCHIGMLSKDECWKLRALLRKVHSSVSRKLIVPNTTRDSNDRGASEAMLIEREHKRVKHDVKPRYSKEEFARRGDAIYDIKILPKLTAKDRGKFLAIDIETGEYEMSRDEMRAGNKLRRRIPEAQIWMIRVGYAATRNFGGGQRRTKLP